MPPDLAPPLASAPRAHAAPIAAAERAGGVTVVIAECRRLLPLFIRFGFVGFAGFLVDLSVVYAARSWVGLYAAGMLSYLCANTVNFSLNRYWTFRHRPRMRLLRHWALFLAATTPGLICNRGAYVLLIFLVPLCAHHPVLAVIAGSIAGMMANFMMSHRVVFSEKRVRGGK